MRTAVIALAGLLGFLGIACSTANAGEADGRGYAPTAAPTETSAQSPHIARLLDGFPFWIENGASVPVSSTLIVDVSAEPYPPVREGVLDLTLRNPGDGKPIIGVRVETTAHMRYMDHGTFRATGTERTGDLASTGQYRVPLRLLMPGEWVVTVRISSGALVEEFDLLVAVNQ